MSAGIDENKKLIVALDLPERRRVLELAGALCQHVAMVKIGLESFVAHGPRLVEEVRAFGVDVFLDLKLHDIPRTVSAAAREASALDVRLLTVHATGAHDMIRAARESAAPDTQILAVTMLTSLDEAAISSLGFEGDVQRCVSRLGRLALDAGADGLVCSAHELVALRGLPGVRVVPGVRPVGGDVGDQKRVATPEAAIKGGATYIVVGRPVVQAPDPIAAAEQLNASLSGLSADHLP